MECKEFLEGYSSYLDGHLDPEEREVFDEHLESCRACARYDRVLQKGLEIFRNLPRPRSSPDFLPRLRHRIYHLEDGIPLESARGGSAAAVAVAAVGLVALTWLPFATHMPVEVELPTVAVEAPQEQPVRAPSLFEPGPFLSPRTGGVGWQGSSFLMMGERRQDPVRWSAFETGGPAVSVPAAASGPAPAAGLGR